MLAKKLLWLLLTIAGAAAFAVALDYPLGTVAAIGPAAYPLILSSIIVLISIYSFFFAPPQESEPLDARAFFCIVSAVIIFILLVEHVGMVPSIMLSMVVAYAGQTSRGYLAFLLYALFFAVGSWLLFSYALNVPLPSFRVP